MKKLSFTILFCFLFTVIGKAQSMLSSGSLYSYYGIGTLNDYRDPNAGGMGLSGIAVFNQVSNLANPGIWGNAVLTSGTGGFYINNIRSNDNVGNTEKTNLNAAQFQLVLPLKKDKFGLSLGMFPISSSNYNYQYQGTFSAAQTGLGTELNYITQNHGTGGINYLELGFGWKIYKNLSIGYAPSIVFGLLKDQVSTNFDLANYQSTRYNKQVSNVGFGNRIGIYYQKARIFNKKDLLSLGATVDLPVHLNSKKSIEYYVQNSSGTSINSTQDLANGSMYLPLRAGFGASYWFSQRVMLGSEILYQKWSDFRGLPGQNVSTLNATLKDRARFGLGVQLMPKESINSTFFKRLSYRLGMSYDTGYLKLNGKNIQTMLISAGLGIPSTKSGSININFDYGMRGTTSNNLVRDRIFSIRLSFNLSEFMFFKQKIQ